MMSDRIIPTRMGTSANEAFGFGNDRDHPHAYGDKRKSFVMLL